MTTMVLLASGVCLSFMLEAVFYEIRNYIGLKQILLVLVRLQKTVFSFFQRFLRFFKYDKNFEFFLIIFFVFLLKHLENLFLDAFFTISTTHSNTLFFNFLSNRRSSTHTVTSFFNFSDLQAIRVSVTPLRCPRIQ